MKRYVIQRKDGKYWKGSGWMSSLTGAMVWDRTYAEVLKVGEKFVEVEVCLVEKKKKVKK